MGAAPQDIDYINAHGTSTPHNVAMNGHAPSRRSRSSAYRLAVSSTKSMTETITQRRRGRQAIATIRP
jgi:3-oxoacyl-[acyl-carrier-protein] synthase II